MNYIYRNEWCLLQNLFYPQIKLKTKVKFGAKCRKIYVDSKTPLDRVLAQHSVSAETKARFIELERTINSFELKKSIETKLKVINKLIQKTRRSLHET